MLSAAQVRHIAQLARLGLSDSDVEKFSKQLSNIFQYIEKLNEVNTDNVVLTSQVTGLKNIMREDKVINFFDREKLLSCSPLPVYQDQIMVPSVITNV